MQFTKNQTRSDGRQFGDRPPQGRPFCCALGSPRQSLKHSVRNFPASSQDGWPAAFLSPAAWTATRTGLWPGLTVAEELCKALKAGRQLNVGSRCNSGPGTLESDSRYDGEWKQKV